MTRGRLITIEGLDGAGKTTLAAALAREIAARGAPVELLREPGGEPFSERIRELVKAADVQSSLGARAEALLYAASRAQLSERVLEPLLASGRWVLLDRFVDSSLAYQGGGRALGLEEVREINRFATGGLAPDRTLLLDITPTLGRARQDGRGEQPDRLEQESERFFEAVAATYDELARAEPGRFRRLDAARPAPEVLSQALEALEDLLVGL